MIILRIMTDNGRSVKKKMLMPFLKKEKIEDTKGVGPFWL